MYYFSAIESYNVDGTLFYSISSEITRWNSLAIPPIRHFFVVRWLLLRVVTVTDCRQQLRYIPYTYVFLSRIHMRPSFLFFEAFKADVFIWPYQMQFIYVCYRVSGASFFLVGLMGLEATN